MATDAEAFVFDLPAVVGLPALSACVASFLAAAAPLKVGVGVAEDLKLLARCSQRIMTRTSWGTGESCDASYQNHVLPGAAGLCVSFSSRQARCRALRTMRLASAMPGHRNR